MHEGKKKRILLIQHEATTWEMARPWTYCAHLGWEDGLHAQDVELVTLVTTWFRHAKEICGDIPFDQVWINDIGHSCEPGAIGGYQITEADMQWIASLAPIRVGILMETIFYTEEEFRANPWLLERLPFIETFMKYVTHVVAVDEDDPHKIELKYKRPTIWSPSSVLGRYLSETPPTPSQRPAIFSGTPYGERAKLLQNPALAKLVSFVPSFENQTELPNIFNRLNGEILAQLLSEPFSKDKYLGYLEGLRMIRRQAFEMYLEGMKLGCATLILPSIVKGYTGRMVESMAAGVPVISWEIPERPKSKRLFTDGREILLYRHDAHAASNLAAQIIRVQRDPALARSLVTNGRAKVMRYHTVEARVEQIFNWIETGEQPSFGEEDDLDDFQTIAGQGFEGNNFFIKPGYQSRIPPEYYEDSLPESSGIIWQPDVYPMAAWLGRKLGCSHILDIGCGHAQKLTALHPEFGVVGVDFGPNMDYCRNRYPFGTWVEWNLESDQSMPIDTQLASQSVVICSDVIEHLVDPTHLLRNIKRLLAYAPVAILSTPERDLTRGPHDMGPPANPCHVREWNLMELKQLLESEGLMVDFIGLTISDTQHYEYQTILAILRGASNAQRLLPQAHTGDAVNMADGNVAVKPGIRYEQVQPGALESNKAAAIAPSGSKSVGAGTGEVKTTVFVLTVGDPVFSSCQQALLEQAGAAFKIEYIRNVSPFNKALQQVIDACETEYFIQLDEDMILYPQAVHVMQETMEVLPGNIGMVCFHLFDDDRGVNIQGVKIYRSKLLKGVQVKDVQASEMDLLEQLAQRGARWVLHPAVMGRHGTFYTPESIYRRYKSMYEKDIRAWNIVETDIRTKADSYRQTGDVLSLFALLGATHGLVNAPRVEDVEAHNLSRYGLKELDIFKRLFLENARGLFPYDPARNMPPLPNPPVPFEEIKPYLDKAQGFPAPSPAVRKKILIACDFFWPAVGGLELIAEDIAMQLIAAGYAVDVATGDQVPRETLNYRGMRIIPLDYTPIDLPLRKASALLHDLIASDQYEACIILADPVSWPIWGAENLPRHRKTRVLIQPLVNREGYQQWQAHELFKKRLANVLKEADGVVVLSGQDIVCDYLRQEQLPRIVVPNATHPIAATIDFRSTYGIPQGMPLILHVANLFSVKNHLGLIASMRTLPGDWRLVLIGAPVAGMESIASAITKAAAEDNRILWIQGLPRDQVGAALEAADILVVPSLAEVSPVVILEAMSHKKAWLATPHCGTANELAGGVVAPLEKFPNVLEVLFKNPALLHRLGELGYAHWQSCFDWKVVTRQWISLINAEAENFSAADIPETIINENRELQARILEQAGTALARQEDANPVAVNSGNLPYAMKQRLQVVAIIAAYNEGDVIYHVIRDLVENGIQVYLIDNSSTDNTVEQAEKWLNKGLLHIERFPQDAGFPERSSKEYVWRDLLTRKLQVARELGADWYIHADADEFRESPWPGMKLVDAIDLVDRLGFSAIAFSVLNFRPVNDDFVPGTDVRDAIHYYEMGEWFDALQVKAWKNTGQQIDLLATGGHEAAFEGRQVFPVSFILRHYPIRGKTHGERKILAERLPRFAQEERAAGWHVQYDALLKEGKKFVWDPAGLEKYDPQAIRARILGNALSDLLIVEHVHGVNHKILQTSESAVLEFLVKHARGAEALSSQQLTAARKSFVEIVSRAQKEGEEPFPVNPDLLPLVRGIAEIECARANVSGDYRLSNLWNKVIPLYGAGNAVAYQPGSRGLHFDTAPGTSDTYRAWISKHSLQEIDGQLFAERMILKWTEKPLVHFIMWLHAGQEQLLADTIDSLGRQMYAQWHLSVIASIPMPDPSFEQFPMLSWIRLGDDGLSPEAGQRLMASRNAGWLAVLEPGMQFEPHYLIKCIDYINIRPHWRLIYTDDDCITSSGARVEPRFKPDLNLDMLRSMPYFGVCLVQKEAFSRAGGLDAVQGAREKNYDLALRVLDKYGEASIGHISDVLYHLPYSASELADSEAERAALIAHLKRNQAGARVESGLVPGTYRVVYQHDNFPLVSIIIPNKDRLEYLEPCLESLLEKTDYPAFEIIIVDNQSSDPDLLEYYQALSQRLGPKLRIMEYHHPFNFSAMNNLAAREARGEYLLLLNNDTQIVQAEWLSRMMLHGQRPEVGCVGARLVYPETSKLQHAGVVLGLLGSADHPFNGMLSLDEPGYMNRAQIDQNYSAVTAACLLIRKAVFEAAGGMNEERFKVLFNDVDLCLKVGQLGYKNVWTPYATVVHHGSTSIKNETADLMKAALGAQRAQAEREALFDCWMSKLANDPAYNRHLSLARTDCSIEGTVVVDWDPNFHDRPRFLGVPLSGGSGEYRIISPFRALSQAGLAQTNAILSPKMFQSRVLLPVELERAKPDTLVLQAAIDDSQMEALRLYSQYNKSVFRIFTLDDLLTQTPKKNSFYKYSYKDAKPRLRKALASCDRLIVTTRPLADLCSSMIGDIRVIPNRLEGAKWSNAVSRRGQGKKPRVGWAGAQQHRGDLEIIHEVVSQTAHEVDWIFFGMCPDELRPYAKEFHDFVLAFDEYPMKLAALNLDLAVAPLEINVFNEAKSNLRLLEYGIMGWPVVCTDIYPYQDAPVKRVTNNPQAWIEAIRERVYNLEAAYAEGDQLRQWVLDRYILEDHLDEWMAALQRG